MADDFDWGGLLGGAGSFLGGLGSIAGGLFGGGKNKAADLLGRQMDRQEIWMKNQMQWRVADAKKAGVHPLAAIGSNITAPSTPGVSVGDSGSNIGESIGQMGQGIGRAVGALMSKDQKYETALRALQVERGELENAVLRKQLADLTAGPAYPETVASPLGQPVGYASGTRGHFSPSNYPVQVTALPGQGDTPTRVKVTPVEQPASVPGLGHIEAGNIPGVRYIKQGDGYQPMPGKESGLQDMELDNPYAFEFWLKNRVLPSVGTGEPPDDARLPKDAAGWWFDTSDGLWKPYHEDPMFPAAVHWLYKKMPWFRYRRSERR